MGGSTPFRQALGTATSTPYDDTHRIAIDEPGAVGVTPGADDGDGPVPQPPRSSTAAPPHAARIRMSTSEQTCAGCGSVPPETLVLTAPGGLSPRPSAPIGRV
ncbi:hypothetical protein GCM10028801_02380 [Nocardioides maradonensis]